MTTSGRRFFDIAGATLILLLFGQLSIFHGLELGRQPEIRKIALFEKQIVVSFSFKCNWKMNGLAFRNSGKQQRNADDIKLN